MLSDINKLENNVNWVKFFNNFIENQGESMFFSEILRLNHYLW